MAGQDGTELAPPLTDRIMCSLSNYKLLITSLDGGIVCSQLQILNNNSRGSIIIYIIQFLTLQKYRLDFRDNVPNQSLVFICRRNNLQSKKRSLDDLLLSIIRAHQSKTQQMLKIGLD
ncbi:conserved hypothetical protein [Ricinus communis]|uniref:Uncharacterized protein n=1 Tax=Ricinus communis TaxID=3988 RepID=B9S0P3_RICCO|nr:conserved hypothetical protein [Ricinus communis]